MAELQTSLSSSSVQMALPAYLLSKPNFKLDLKKGISQRLEIGETDETSLGESFDDSSDVKMSPLWVQYVETFSGLK